MFCKVAGKYADAVSILISPTSVRLGLQRKTLIEKRTVRPILYSTAAHAARGMSPTVPAARSYRLQWSADEMAYRIQEIAYGGLDEQTRKRMENLLNDEGYDALGRKPKNPGRRANLNAIVPGTILTREWQLRTRKKGNLNLKNRI